MGKRYTVDFVKSDYKKNSISIKNQYHSTSKILILECDLCHFRWDEYFNEMNSLCCPQCGSKTEKVNKKKSKVEKVNKKKKIKNKGKVEKTDIRNEFENL